MQTKNPFRAAREKKGISRLEFSELLKLPRSVVEQIESSTWERTRVSYLLQICKSLDLSLAELLREKFGYTVEGASSPSEEEFEDLVTRFANSRVSLFFNELESLCKHLSLKLSDFDLKSLSFSAKNLHTMICINEKLSRKEISNDDARSQLKSFFQV